MYLAKVFAAIVLIFTVSAITPVTDIRLFPNTESSPSIYLLQFTLSKSLPSNSYILVTMNWYTSAVIPYNCILVNTSITVACTNFDTPTFALTITKAQMTQYNTLFDSAKTVAVLVNSNLLADTTYALQLHLYNVIPSIRKISPNI
jgi:hypothetical protein